MASLAIQAAATGNDWSLTRDTQLRTQLETALKDRPEIRECVETLANRAAKSGVELPGMTISTEQRAA